MTDPQAIQVGIPTQVAGPLADKLRELRGLPTNAPESDLYDTHPGVVQLTGNWTRTALELARVGEKMLATKDIELAARTKMLGLEYDEIFDQLQMANRKLDARESELEVANRELSEVRSTAEHYRRVYDDEYARSCRMTAVFESMASEKCLNTYPPDEDPKRLCSDYLEPSDWCHVCIARAVLDGSLWDKNERSET